MSQQNDFLLRNRTPTYGSTNVNNIPSTNPKEMQEAPQPEDPNSFYNVLCTKLNIFFFIMTILAIVAVTVILILFK